MSYVVVRVRGQPERRHDHKRTLASLRLHYPNHATIVPVNPSYKGMVKNVEHLTTYGELSKETAAKLLTARGRIPGNEPLTDAYVSEHTDYDSIEALAEAIASDELDIGHIDAIKPVFRLNPPRGGFEGTKRHFVEGGALGYRGEEINALIERML